MGFITIVRHDLGNMFGIFFQPPFPSANPRDFHWIPKGRDLHAALCHHFFMGQDVSFRESISWTCGNLGAVASHPVPQKHSRKDYHPLKLNIKTKWCQKKGGDHLRLPFLGPTGRIFRCELAVSWFLNFDQIFYGQSSPTAQSNVHLHPQK